MKIIFTGYYSGVTPETRDIEKLELSGRKITSCERVGHFDPEAPPDLWQFFQGIPKNRKGEWLEESIPKEIYDECHRISGGSDIEIYRSYDGKFNRVDVKPG